MTVSDMQSLIKVGSTTFSLTEERDRKVVSKGSKDTISIEVP